MRPLEVMLSIIPLHASVMLIPLFIVLLLTNTISASLSSISQPGCQLLRDDSPGMWQYAPGALDACYWNLTFSDLTDVDSLREFECASARGFNQFRRVEVDAARQCLRNKHIVFIGDSHMRFQFDALVIFLETGKYQSPLLRSFGNRLSLLMPPLDAAGQSVVMRQESSMAYNYPNGTYKNGTHACQKYYHNPALGLTVSLLGLYGFSYGHEPVGWPNGMANPMPFGAAAWGPGGPQELVNVISQHIGQVDEIVMNVGQWKYWPPPRTGEWMKKYRSTGSPAHAFTNEATSAIIDELKHFSSLVKKGLPIWATTTQFRDKDAPELFEPAVAATQLLGWRVLDRNTITKRLKQALALHGLNGTDLGYVDYAHLAPFVNTEINNVLLNMIC